MSKLAVAVRPGERVVEQRQRAVPPGEPGDAGDIGDLEHRVGRRFEHDHPHRPLPEHPLETVEIVYRQQAARDAEAAQHTPDQAARRLVHLGEVHDMVALLAERQQAGRDRGHPRPGKQTAVPALQLRERVLELAQGGVRDARVIETRAAALIVPLGLGDVVEGELDRLVDGRDQRAVVRRNLDIGEMGDARALLHRCRRLVRRAGQRPGSNQLELVGIEMHREPGAERLQRFHVEDRGLDAVAVTLARHGVAEKIDAPRCRQGTTRRCRRDRSG